MNVPLRRMQALGNFVANTLFPQIRCIVCGEEADGQSGLCGACHAVLATLRLAQPLCPLCGAPGSATPCPECHGMDFAFSAARCAYAYKGCARTLILRMKFRGEAHHTVAHLAPAMLESLMAHPLPIDALVPMPLSRARLLARGYNQAARLGAWIARESGIPLRESLVWRNRETAQQAELHKEQRAENVRGAFSAHPSAKGLRIALIDDVLTTGHTASSCAKALLDAGARDVLVLTAARALE